MDIDSDLHTEKRQEVIDYVKSIYGEHAVCNILTKGYMAGKSAIRNVGRVTNMPDSVIDLVVKTIPAKPNAKICDADEDLADIIAENPVAAQLVKDAESVENIMVNYGMHAAGVIISDNDDVGEYVAMMYNTDKGQWVAQCDKKQCEEDAGMLKMDFLGLKNLDIITDTLRRIKRNYGITVDIESVPVDDAQVYKKIFSAGNTGSVFQFESGGMRKMLKQFEPASMDDLILLVAAYRPGPLQYIPGVIKSKHGIEKPVYIANGLEEILSSTYGYTIYQEQVMEIFHKIAGLSLGEADIVRRAMAKKHLDELTDPKTNYHGKLVDGLCKNGATKDQAEQFWNELLSFASYAFNKSHAAAYAHVAYYTAWLKCHYPAEYMSSVMARTELNKLPEVLADSRQMGLKIKAPDINESDVDFVNIEDTIIFGFNNCKGVGNSGSAIVEERKANGKFSSIKNFVYRMSDNKQMNKSVYEALIKGGAFDEFCKGNRHSLLNGMEEFVALTKKLRAKQVETEQRKMAYDDAVASHASAKETKKRETALNNSRKALETLQTNFEKHTFTTLGEDADRLSNEYEVLGIYVSGHPIDAYQATIDKLKGVTPIARLSTSGKCGVCGIVAKATVLHRKSDNAPFLKFTLMDASGEITCMCWTKTYVTLKELLVNGEAVRINGKIISKDTGKDDETENIEIEISVESASRLKKPNNDIIMIRGTMSSWIANQKSIKAFADDEGCEGVFYDTTLCEFRNLKYRLSKKILSANFNGLSIIKKPLVKH